MKAVRSSSGGRARVSGEVFRVKAGVRGVVQGVGFRPFVYQLAARHGLKGWVCNTSEDVRIDIEGGRGAVEKFLADLEAQAPPLARIEGITTEKAPAAGYEAFEIRQSLAEEGRYQLVSPDIATCPACREEVLSPQDRRYRYPFTNCTNCGPRFTIIEDIPYDRPKTTMRHFEMCPQCRQEYEDPLNRRFHAQPNACPVCGPRLKLTDNEGQPMASEDVLSDAARLLRKGKILGVKGIGGFLLACDATSDGAVRLLRERKQRPSKPFAVMLATLEGVKKHAEVSPEEEALLTSPAAPIVLLKWREGSTITAAVAPQNNYLGVMLPYTPLHHVLCREVGTPLVMTSGNLSEEPIAKDNDEAVRRLVRIADYFLLHNRDIYARYDDSVVMVAGGRTQMIRRARGYAPYPVKLPFRARPVLACGPELKNTFCLTRDNYAFLSQHIGDMENLETLEHFENTIGLYKKLFRIEPEMIAYDMHPDYLSTKYAKELIASSGLPSVAVQHHHAHIAACLAENGLDEPVIGVALDGTGYGSDGRIWGGEFLKADCRGFERLGHLQYVPLPGGAAAIERPYRMAISYLISLLGEDALSQNLPFLHDVDDVEIELIKKQISQGINAPLTSSCGRLFDAVAALIGVRGKVDYEAQAAIELEMIAAVGNDSYPFEIADEGGVNIVKFNEMLAAIVADMNKGVSPSGISGKFHRTVAEVVLQMCRRLAGSTGLRKVALSGGVFQNRLLLTLTVAALEKDGLEVLQHRAAPANDGCIALGQAVIAAFSRAEK